MRFFRILTRAQYCWIALLCLVATALVSVPRLFPPAHERARAWAPDRIKVKLASYQQPGRLSLEGGAGWLNTSGPIHLEELRGKVVLLDFWTYCCINCMHVLPDLAFLEDKYKNELVVIGVHTAKFEAEKSTENIRKKVAEYRIKHPVMRTRCSGTDSE
jgi:thiol-disulfide isomerase/thioredoxin